MIRQLALVLLVTGSTLLASCRSIPPRTMYARCNLKVLKGYFVTWLNYQSTRTVIRAGTELTVSGGPQKWALVDATSGKRYVLDAGAAGDRYLEKFVSGRVPDTFRLPDSVLADVRAARARIGMTREQVYMAMGPPVRVDYQDSNYLDYDAILAGELWTYRRAKFRKNIGVRFDPETGLVVQTEGVWW